MPSAAYLTEGDEDEGLAINSLIVSPLLGCVLVTLGVGYRME
jgi:hypothetical protein